MKVIKKGDYFYVKDDLGSTLAGYSNVTKSCWGIPEYFGELMKVVRCNMKKKNKKRCQVVKQIRRKKCRQCLGRGCDCCGGKGWYK